MSEPQVAIQIEGLTKAYGPRLVLRDVAVTIRRGETVALMGANGAGKTTLLRCVAATVRPTAGRVRCFDADMQDPSRRALLGVVGHESRLYPNLTLQENLCFAARMFALPHAERLATERLQQFGLEHHADRLPRQVSRGMRQRVSLARACLHEPRILLLDEPFSGLDAEGRELLVSLFHKWKQQRQTVCFATHDESAAASLADRVLRVKAGRLEADEDSTAVPKIHPHPSEAA